MSLNEQTISVYLALVFGIAVFLWSCRFLVGGVRVYRQSFVRRVGAGLRESFVFMDARALFVFNLILLTVAGAVGLLAAGIAGLVLAVIVVAVMPSIVLRALRRRRSARFVYQLPDCLSTVASSLRAGTSLARSLEQVAAQQPAPVSQEFAVVLSDYKMGRTFEDALQDMNRRIGKPEVELLNSAISISRSVGGNLADTLDTLAATLRETAQMEGKIHALTAMGRMQGWVVGLMPVALIAVLYKNNPASMRPLFTEHLGWLTLGVLAAMMITAMLMIRKIVSIDI